MEDGMQVGSFLSLRFHQVLYEAKGIRCPQRSCEQHYSMCVCHLSITVTKSPETTILQGGKVHGGPWFRAAQ